MRYLLKEITLNRVATPSEEPGKVKEFGNWP